MLSLTELKYQIFRSKGRSVLTALTSLFLFCAAVGTIIALWLLLRFDTLALLKKLKNGGRFHVFNFGDSMPDFPQ